jgi:hypothetical protein
MLRSLAVVATEKSERYAAQLCKHFAHKVPAHYTDGRGVARLPPGDCMLTAEAGRLTLSVEAETEEKLKLAEAIVGGHLERFAWRESLSVAWVRSPK